MRVLLTTYLLRGGVLTHVWDLVYHLEQAGVSVSVAILKKNPALKTQGKIYRAKSLPSMLGPIEKVPFIYYETPQELGEFCRKQKIDLIHAHSRLAFPSSLVTAKRLKIPLIVTLHGVFRWNRFYPSTLSYSQKIIAIGPAQTKGAERHNEKIEIIANGIDTIRFCPSFNRSLTRLKNLKVLWFGRTDKQSSRGVEALDQAIGILRAQGKIIDAWLLGRPIDASIHNLKNLGWSNNPVPILQTGHLAFGHGRALREAMSCGNVGFLLGHGYGGQITSSWFSGEQEKPISAIPDYQLAEPDANKIAADISSYLHNRHLLYQHRLEARDIAIKHFDVRTMVAGIIRVYRQCVQTPLKKNNKASAQLTMRGVDPYAQF
ncbi:glycosyltransferase family 4 protein [Dethiobacter alkaliphilus]|uniref:glycosyltransferase family 4 protein n=1 Tax=Dethiobacter alkaliphilus TaxID=427926 RepID=UPI0022279257|nr:glycosyltransferase family 4 protein [Dethiobacter alkaliphilus]MCW3489255.1 glycosyltransferase family 4 protein [Dethiobacter alkaliphilus]